MWLKKAKFKIFFFYSIASKTKEKYEQTTHQWPDACWGSCHPIIYDAVRKPCSRAEVDVGGFCKLDNQQKEDKWCYCLFNFCFFYPYFIYDKFLISDSIIY